MNLEELRVSFKAAALGMALSAGVLTGMVMSDMGKENVLPAAVLPAAFLLFTTGQLISSSRQIRKAGEVIFPAAALR